jgi:hypothetical protein
VEFAHISFCVSDHGVPPLDDEGQELITPALHCTTTYYLDAITSEASLIESEACLIFSWRIF